MADDFYLPDAALALEPDVPPSKMRTLGRNIKKGFRTIIRSQPLTEVPHYRMSEDGTPVKSKRPLLLGAFVKNPRPSNPPLLADLCKDETLRNEPIFTVDTFRRRTYVLNNYALISQAFGEEMSLFWNPFNTRNILGYEMTTPYSVALPDHPGGVKAIARRLGGKWQRYIMGPIARSFAEFVSQRDLNGRFMSFLEKRLLDVAPVGGWKIMDLYLFIRDEYSAALIEAMYGSNCSLNKSDMLNDVLWAYEALRCPQRDPDLPGGISPAAQAAHDKLVDAMEAYIDSDHYMPFNPADFEPNRAPNPNAYMSKLVARRREIFRGDHSKLSNREIAHVELMLLQATLYDTVPTVFWTIYHIFESPSILEKMRNEAAQPKILSRTDDRGIREVMVPAVRHFSPPLTAIYSEVLRLYNNAVFARKVEHSSVLDDPSGLGGGWKIKRGSAIRTPISNLHETTDENVWGSQPKQFDWDRLIPSLTPAGQSMRFLKTAVESRFAPFGLGRADQVGCPAKELAENQILATALLFIYIFDIREHGKKEGEPLTHPGTGDPSLGSFVPKPERSLEVATRRRGNGNLVRFKFEFKPTIEIRAMQRNVSPF